MSGITDEIKKRRTFAIISHPDAGKTTLTEKFLLYGGAINQAGSVKGKATAKHAVSDWMEIEKERGIHVNVPTNLPYGINNLFQSSDNAQKNKNTDCHTHINSIFCFSIFELDCKKRTHHSKNPGLYNTH